MREEKIFNKFQKFSHNTIVHPCALYGGVQVSYQLKTILRGSHIIIGTPSHLLEFISKVKVVDR